MKYQVKGLFSPQFFDDAERDRARNGTPALASLMAREIEFLIMLAYSGRPVYTMTSRGSELNPDRFVRQVYWPQNLGAQDEGCGFIRAKHGDPDTGSFQDGQGVSLTIGSTTALRPVLYNGTPTASVWPTDATADWGALMTSRGRGLHPEEMKVTSETNNGPDVRAATVMQLPVVYADPSPSGGAVIGSDDVVPTGDIIGSGGDTIQALARFSEIYSNTFQYMRPQFGWSAQHTVGGADGHIDFTTSRANYRYIFDQTYGAGGTSFAADAPAMTLPLMYSAAGRRTQVRVYVFIYASMSGSTNTGSIGVANKNASGTMASSASTITNGPTISGTTFAWYPTLSSWSESSSPYFNAYAGTTFDRVALCAKSSGTTDAVRIGAFTLVPIHTTL